MTDTLSILVATDFSERAERAEKRAARLCLAHQCKALELATVKEGEQPETLALIIKDSVDEARKLIADSTLNALKSRAASLTDNFGVDCGCAVVFGNPAREIASRAEEIDADLIVVGAHGGNFFSDLLLGNTANKLLHLCKRPLLIVKNEPCEPYRNILVPVDFSEDSLEAARMALRIEPQANLIFLHAYDVWFEGKMHYANVEQDVIDHYRIQARENARIALNDFIDSLGVPDWRPARDIVFGLPGKVVRDYAEKMQPDLIVMGKHGRSRMEELLVGSVTRDTVDQTGCDVLVVPSVQPS